MEAWEYEMIHLQILVSNDSLMIEKGLVGTTLDEQTMGAMNVSSMSPSGSLMNSVAMSFLTI